MEIVSGIHQLHIPIPNNPLGHVNCYLVQGREGWLLIDPGWNTDVALAILQTGLKELGLNLDDVTTIIVTHVHPDHFGLTGRIKQVSPKTELIAHSWESNVIESRYIKMAGLMEKMAALLRLHGVPQDDQFSLESASMPALQFVTVTLPDHLLFGGEIINTGVFELEVIWTPGHSPGHICLYEPVNRLLFSGDHILPVVTPNVGYHVQSGDNPLGDYINALHKIENLPVDRVLPGHEDIFDNMRQRIQQLIAHHDARKSEIREVIAGEAHTAWEISSHITWDNGRTTFEQLSTLHKRLAVSETVAHLEYMRWGGEVEKTTKDGQVSYMARG